MDIETHLDKTAPVSHFRGRIGASGPASSIRGKGGNMSRPVALLGFGLLACLLILVPTAGAALDPTDTATGTGALANENGGIRNTADGYFALNANTTGIENTAVGWLALSDNDIGSDYNTAVGSVALSRNTSGEFNTAVGALTLSLNTTSDFNTAVGGFALDLNTGENNTAVGAATLTGNDGDRNTAVGDGALSFNTDGNRNTAVGRSALVDNEAGSDNTAVGNFAGVTETFANANRSGSRNTFVGFASGPGTPTQLNNATALGAGALVTEDNAVVLGALNAKVGVGTTAPKSLLQLGTPSTTYGSYLQLPMVTSGSPPPAGDCNASTFVGRLVLQYDAAKTRITLWSCSAAGVWTELAKG
jgi:hypothetical protein